MSLRQAFLNLPRLRRALVYAPALALVAAATGCTAKSSFSDIPEIAPVEVKVYHITKPGGRAPLQFDSVTVMISWIDGDGDLGLLPNTDVGEMNYFLTLYKRKAGAFVAITPANSFNGRFINLNPEGEESTKRFKIRGDLTYAVNSAGFLMTPPQVVGTINNVNEYLRAGDVIRFDVQIKDRAGHLSNVVSTEAVTL